MLRYIILGMGQIKDHLSQVGGSGGYARCTPERKHGMVAGIPFRTGNKVLAFGDGFIQALLLKVSGEDCVSGF